MYWMSKTRICPDRQNKSISKICIQFEYVGNAFADKWEGTWYLYNNKVNTNEKQHAILPLEGEEESARLKVEMEPHEFMIMNESGDGTAMDITLNNYRVNKDEIIFDNKSA